MIKKKNKENLTIEEIEKSFLKKNSKSGIIAYFVEKNITNKESFVFEYFDEEKFS